MNDDWWHAPRFIPPAQRWRPDAEVCWCCGQPTGQEGHPWEMQCPACDVQWYGGTRPLVLSNGTPVTR